MHRFRKILVSVNCAEGKSEAFKQAVKLARQIGALITVVDVVRELPAFVVSLMPAPTEHLDRQRSERLRVLKAWAASEEVPLKTKVLHGRTAHALIREVIEGSHDLVVRDAHVDEGADLIFGSVDLRLMRNCPCPVWLVRAGHHGSYDRVLAAIDCQPTPQGDAMNARIMDMSSSLADSHESQLHVVSAWRGIDDFEDEWGDWEPPNSKLVEDAAWDAVNRLVSKCRREIPSERIHVQQGIAGDTVCDVAAEINADLIVMGTLARTGIPGLLIGNTAERVLRDVDCSVLTIKPHEFVSPIRSPKDEGAADFSTAWAPA